MKEKIAVIKIQNENYKSLFCGPNNELSRGLIRLLIKTFGYTYNDNIAIAFINDDELSFYITPFEFLNSHI